VPGPFQVAVPAVLPWLLLLMARGRPPGKDARAAVLVAEFDVGMGGTPLRDFVGCGGGVVGP
jgi:hypothetical protein